MKKYVVDKNYDHFADEEFLVLLKTAAEKTPIYTPRPSPLKVVDIKKEFEPLDPKKMREELTQIIVPINGTRSHTLI